jgi:enolase
VNTKLADAILGKVAYDQKAIDQLLLDADGTENKGNLGANAILAVSLATARAAALSKNLPLYRYLGGEEARRLPRPMMNILNGGAHADNTVDLQEFMIVPMKAATFAEGLRICAEIYQVLKKLCKERKLSTAVGDEGGYAPDLANSNEVLELIVEAVKKAGYVPGEDIKIAIDAAASELYDEKINGYFFPGESQMLGKNVVRTTEEMVAYYEDMVNKYPIVSIEDGLNEEDWDGWQLITKRLGDKIQLVGDDLFVTNSKRLQKGIDLKAANAILVKVNQIGTLTETLDAIHLAQKNGYNTIISHRSGETEDTFIADIAVAVNSGQIKSGAPARTERVAKYNQLVRIEEELGAKAIFN